MTPLEPVAPPIAIKVTNGHNSPPGVQTADTEAIILFAKMNEFILCDCFYYPFPTAIHLF